MRKNLLVIGGLLLLASMALAQTSITDMEVPFTQDFNTLSSNTSASQPWTDNVTLPGWYSNRTSYWADSGQSNAGALKSYGHTADADRALGSLGSGSVAHPMYGWRLANNTGDIIRSLLVSFTGEQWRIGNITTSDTRTDTLIFRYQVAAIANNCSTGAWTEVPQLMFEGPYTQLVTGTFVDGNLPASQHYLSYRFDVTVNPGDEIMIAWKDTNNIGGDAGIAIDNLSLTAFNMVGVAGAPTAINHAIRLMPVQPNPASQIATIRYSLAQSGKVSVNVFNMLGQQVATLASGIQSAGAHQIRWTLNNDLGRQVPNGVYFVKLSAGGRSDMRKMIVAR